MAEDGKIIQINIEDEMKSAYIDYSMSVIVSRAIPDVRDGMKPVHRRVLYGMNDLGLAPNKPHKKSARIVGEVLGKYHPHGDTSVYDAMVRMAQDWSLRYPLVDGQGNYGSVDGDPPAAMRYTEARFKKISEDTLKDIEKETVDFQLNFDDSLKEPTVLPTRVPHLLLNGTSGIAVGMATNMLPHNLTEIINGMMAYIDNTSIEISELMQHITAPDFPTGGTIYGYDGVKEAFETGRGKVVLRGKTFMEVSASGREKIIVNEIPYQVNKSVLIQKISELVNDGRIDGIADINDESDRQGMRIVIALKKDAIPNIVLNKLFKMSQLQTSYGVNNIALVNGRPMLLNLKDLIKHFIEFRHDVITRRTKYDLRKAEERAHILEGLIIASDNIDEVIKIIRASNNTETARENLIERFSLSDIQARAIVEMRLRQLTGLEQDKLRGEYDEIMKTITHLKEILASEPMRMQIIKDELTEMLEKYGDERRTDIEFAAGNFDITDLIPDEPVVLTISNLGYIKRTQVSEYRIQNRGGKGSKGSSTRNADFIEYMFTATTHNNLLFFTEKGKCFWMNVYNIPEGNKHSKGRAIQNLMNIESDDKILAFIPIKDLKDDEFLDSHYMLFATKKGTVKKTSLREYSRPRTNGVNAINIKEGDALVRVRLTTGDSEVLLATKKGRAVRFNEADSRPMGRTATGVRGVRLNGDDDALIGMVAISKDDKESTILVVSENGYGKRTLLDEFDEETQTWEPVYRVTKRGGKGVKTLNITEKTGQLIAVRSVTDNDDLMIINKSGIALRLELENIRTQGRATQGVRLINLGKKDSIAAVSIIKEAKQDREQAALDALNNPEFELDEDGNPVLDNEGNPMLIVSTEEGEEGNSEESTENEDSKESDNEEE
ncbi:MAG: DNA gyrase subunit A [Planctomycetota bacterium]|jgi:DNA gyrase subunit A